MSDTGLLDDLAAFREKAERAWVMYGLMQAEATLRHSAVDTGLFKGNWRHSELSPDTGYDGDSVDTNVKVRLDAAVGGVSLAAPWYLSNNSPYAMVLDEGHDNWTGARQSKVKTRKKGKATYRAKTKNRMPIQAPEGISKPVKREAEAQMEEAFRLVGLGGLIK